MKRSLAIISILLLTFPLFILVPTLLGLVGIIGYADKLNEPSTVGVLAYLLITFSTFVLPGILGLILLAISVDGIQFRPKWLFKWMFALGIVWLCCLPVGSIVGIALLLYTILNRRKFGDEKTKTLNVKTTSKTVQEPEQPSDEFSVLSNQKHITAASALFGFGCLSIVIFETLLGAVGIAIGVLIAWLTPAPWYFAVPCCMPDCVDTHPRTVHLPPRCTRLRCYFANCMAAYVAQKHQDDSPKLCQSMVTRLVRQPFLAVYDRSAFAWLL